MIEEDPALNELTFPVLVHFKIICEMTENIRAHLEIALWELNIAETLREGRISNGGKYRSYDLSVTVFDRERLRSIDARLRTVQGVRMVM